jgi:cation diffusion facilitator CzcD-associated flavoprotein CzcO
VNEISTAVIGAGPYGLSVAAHLDARGVDTQVFGKTMEFWKNMPGGLNLKSPWTASSLSDPRGYGSLNNFVTLASATKPEPIPLEFFLRYGAWFQHELVPNVDPTYVESLSQEGSRFRFRLADGRSLTASRVVVAVGINQFAHIPEFARDLPSTLAGHTQSYSDYSRFKGAQVMVVGTGQSALESAALLHEAGADVEVIARGPINWVNRKLYHTGPARRVFYPPTDVGPPGINWIVAFPLLVRHFPTQLRMAMHRRSTRPAGATWLRSRVEGRIRLSPNTTITGATVNGDRLRIALGDGSSRDVDQLVLGTGFRPNLDRISFIDPALRSRVQRWHGFPVLNRWFESSVPRLHFVGGVGGYSFGPLCNFVAGAGVAARQVARCAAGATLLS